MVHIPLIPARVTLADLHSLWTGEFQYQISDDARPAVDKLRPRGCAWRRPVRRRSMG